MSTTFTILPKTKKMIETFEMKLEKPFEMATQEEFEAICSAMVLKTIMETPEKIKFFAPLETETKIEEVEKELEAHKIPKYIELVEIYLEIAPVFKSFIIPPTELVRAFLAVIEEREAIE